jgi:hypothetical protein
MASRGQFGLETGRVEAGVAGEHQPSNQRRVGDGQLETDTSIMP